MPLETASHITDLVSTNPASGDQVAVADDHLRLIKSVLLTDFATINGPITATVAEINSLNGILKTQLDRAGSLTTAGTATAYTLTSNTVFASLSAMNGKAIIFKPHVTSGASPTLNVDGLGAVALKSIAGTVIPTGALLIGGRYAVTYNDSATEFVVHGIFGVLPSTQFSGAVTVLSGGLTVTAGGLSVTAGGATITAGGLTVSASGAAITGNSSVTGNLALSGIVGVGATDHMFPASGTTAQRSGTTESSVRYNTTLHGLEYYNGTTWVVLGQQPTIQVKTVGSGTYTPTTGMVRARVRMVGGGGGGGAVATNSGNNGTATTFTPNGGSVWTADFGRGGVVGTGTRLGGVGGTVQAAGTGTRIAAFAGQNGGFGSGSATAIAGPGGSTPFGGGGVTVGINSNGTAAAANTGSGGSGTPSSSANNGAGGAAASYEEFWITAAQLNGTAAYVVGAKGTGGAAGTFAGGDGADGYLIIEEFYS